MICTKTVTLEITGGTQAWLTLDSADPFTNTDSVTGNPVTIQDFDSASTAVPAIISNGVHLGAITDGILTSSSLQFSGGSFSMCFWVNSDGTGNDDAVSYTWDTNNSSYLTWVDNGAVASLELAVNGVATPFAMPSVGTGSWHFIVFKFDGANNHLYYSIDGAVFVDAGDLGMAIPAAADPNAKFFFSSSHVTFDEMAVFSMALSENQKNALWNGGAGQTFPPVLGPP